MKSDFTVRSVLVKFGTNRNPNCVDSVVQFGAERGTNLHLGVSSVEVGDIHQFGSHGRSWFAWANQMFRHVIQATQNSSIDVRSTSIISDPEAFGQFSRYLAESFEKPHHMLYVHGFNTNFDFALKQAGRLAADLKVSGNTFLFSWPSKGSLAQYSADEASVGACYPFFAEYLEIILRAIGDMSLTIIAHSMGNRLLTRWISDQGKVSIKPFIKNAILVFQVCVCFTWIGLNQFTRVKFHQHDVELTDDFQSKQRRRVCIVASGVDQMTIDNLSHAVPSIVQAESTIGELGIGFQEPQGEFSLNPDPVKNDVGDCCAQDEAAVIAKLEA